MSEPTQISKSEAFKIIRKKVNNEKIELIPKTPNLLNFKPDNLFSEPYPPVLMLAKRGSGKTTVLYNLIKKYANPNTIVFFFCSQIYQDDSYLNIIKYLKSKNIPYIIETSLFTKGPNKKNQLEKLMEYLESRKSPEWSELDPYSESSENDTELLDNIDKSKEIMIIIDDLASELKCTPVRDLMKTNRHKKIRLFISTQYLNDLHPDCLNALSYVFAFPSIQIDKKVDKLQELYGKLGGIRCPYEHFKKLYLDATEKNPDEDISHNFLFINNVESKLRRNLDDEYTI